MDIIHKTTIIRALFKLDGHYGCSKMIVIDFVANRMLLIILKIQLKFEYKMIIFETRACNDPIVVASYLVSSQLKILNLYRVQNCFKESFFFFGGGGSFHYSFKL